MSILSLSTQGCKLFLKDMHHDNDLIVINFHLDSLQQSY